MNPRTARCTSGGSTLLGILAFVVPVSLGEPTLYAQPKSEAADICVYGATAGGVAAAVQAGRSGRSVILIEPSRHLGGLSSGGLGATDIGNKSAIGGISLEFYHRVAQHYSSDSAWTQET